MSVDKIIELREAAMAGSHDPITVKDLVKVRLPEDYWKNLIDHGEFSLEMPEMTKSKIAVSTKGDPEKENASKLTFRKNGKTVWSYFRKKFIFFFVIDLC